MVFLLFENILKNLYKASENMMEFEELYMNNVDKSLNVASLMDRFKEAINEYQMHEDMLNEIDRSFYQRWLIILYNNLKTDKNNSSLHQG